MSHGGKREGAGRKPAPDKKQAVSIKLPPWLIHYMDSQPESRAVQIERWAARCGVTPQKDGAAYCQSAPRAQA